MPRLPRPPQWVKPRPRTIMTVRVRREYQQGLTSAVEHFQRKGFTGLTVGLLAETLLEDVITDEGWERIEQKLRQNELGFRPPIPEAGEQAG